PASGEPLAGWEQWADDARAVLDAVGSERALLLGLADGGPVALLFAATHPSRTRGLIVAHTPAWFAAGGPGPYDAGTVDFVAQAYGTPALAEFTHPDAARDPAFVRWFGRSTRLSMSPRAFAEMTAAEAVVVGSGVLESVRVPTLVLNRE